MKQRKLSVKIFSEKHLQELSDKIFQNSEKQLTKAIRDVFIEEIDNKKVFKTTYKQVVFNTASEIKEWEKNWINMTPFEITPIKPIAAFNIYFSESYTNEILQEIFGQTITDNTKSLNYPRKEPADTNKKRYYGTRGNPSYPIYVISKGRSKTCITADHLLKMGVPFKIVIEKQEWNDYSEVYGDDMLIELDLSFRGEYDTYIENFDISKSKGSGPARNFVWWHAKNVVKSDWHWIMDDNIMGFHYYNDNERIKAVDGTVFAAAEDFVNRYDNIGISGLNYYMFAVPGCKDKPYVSNTKIYSCLLINNHIPIRWAGRYNEDVDICIRALKEGYSTIQFDAFLARKMATQTMGGGNTDAFYAEEGTLPKSNMLMHNHPDITEVMWRFSRWHHITNYDIFDYYKDRTVKEIILDICAPQILDEDEDKHILDEIRKIDFSRIKKWNILTSVETSKRDRILKVLKFYRYKKDNDFIISLLTRPKLLNCDLNGYILDSELEDTIDNRFMKDLFKLANEDGTLTKSIDFYNYFNYLPENKKDVIIKEIIRNKYLLKDEIKTYEYGIKELLMTEEDHINHKDSKIDIENILNGTNNEPITTLFDKKIRKEEVIKPTSKFKSKLTKRGQKIEKDHNGYTLMVIGDEKFSDEELFLSECESYIKTQEFNEIINSVNYKIDLFAANYALDNKFLNREFVPDFLLFNTSAYKEMYKDMINYTNECLIFVESDLTPDLKYLVELLDSENKKYKIIKSINTNNMLEDW